MRHSTRIGHEVNRWICRKAMPFGANWRHGCSLNVVVSSANREAPLIRCHVSRKLLRHSVHRWIQSTVSTIHSRPHALLSFLTGEVPERRLQINMSIRVIACRQSMIRITKRRTGHSFGLRRKRLHSVLRLHHRPYALRPIPVHHSFMGHSCCIKLHCRPLPRHHRQVLFRFLKLGGTRIHP